MIAYMLLNKFKLPFSIAGAEEEQIIQKIKNQPIDFQAIQSETGRLIRKTFCGKFAETNAI